MLTPNYMKTTGCSVFNSCFLNRLFNLKKKVKKIITIQFKVLIVCSQYYNSEKDPPWQALQPIAQANTARSPFPSLRYAGSVRTVTSWIGSSRRGRKGSGEREKC